MRVDIERAGLTPLQQSIYRMLLGGMLFLIFAMTLVVPQFNQIAFEHFNGQRVGEVLLHPVTLGGGLCTLIWMGSLGVSWARWRMVAVTAAFVPLLFSPGCCCVGPALFAVQPYRYPHLLFYCYAAVPVLAVLTFWPWRKLISHEQEIRLLERAARDQLPPPDPADIEERPGWDVARANGDQRSAENKDTEKDKGGA